MFNQLLNVIENYSMGHFYIFVFYLLGACLFVTAFLELFTSTRPKAQKYMITGAYLVWSLCVILVLPRFIPDMDINGIQ